MGDGAGVTLDIRRKDGEERKRIFVSGAVEGVGVRPFV
jgi:hypothetical protein